MLDSILDLVSVVSPVAIALMSALVGIKLAKNPHDQSHKGWWYAIVGLGLICSVGTYWQQERSRKAHSEEIKVHAEELKNQKQATDGLQSSLDYMNGQVAAFGSMLGQISQTGSLNVKEISNAMKRLGQDNKLPGDKNLAIRTKLGLILEEYEEIRNMSCSPPQIGLPTSGAAETVESCDQKYGAWSQRASAYICGSGELEAADCTEYRWKKS